MYLLNYLSASIICLMIVCMLVCPILASGQLQVEKPPKYLVLHAPGRSKGKVIRNNSFTRARLPDGRKVPGPFMVDSSFLYTPTDTLSHDSIALIRTFNPGLATLGLIGFGVESILLAPAFAYIASITATTGAVVLLLLVTVPTSPAVLTAVSFRRVRFTTGMTVEGRSKYPWNLSRENSPSLPNR